MQISLETTQLTRLRAVAHSSQRSVAAVVREAVSEWLQRHETDSPWQRAMDAVGGFHSGLGDLAENHDEYLVAGDLVSVSEIAARSGRPVSTVQSWRRRYASFPSPMTTLATGPVWDWDEVQRWMRRHASGETRRRRHEAANTFPADLPGADLVAAGLHDIALGRSSTEAALVSMATGRLRELGVELPGRATPRPADRLYQLVEQQVGEAGAHSRYNALRRRLSSFIRALAAVNAQAG